MDPFLPPTGPLSLCNKTMCCHESSGGFLKQLWIAILRNLGGYTTSMVLIHC